MYVLEVRNIAFDDSKHSYDDDGNIDIDLLYKYGKNKEKTLEIKTSLVPDFYCKDMPDDISKIKKCIELFDIKLIRRNGESIEQLKGDIHLQIYYAHLREAKDKILKKIYFSFNIDKVNDINIVIDSFVGWIDKETLIQQINNKLPKDRIWSFKGSKREFWVCNLFKEAKKPSELIDFLKNLH